MEKEILIKGNELIKIYNKNLIQSNKYITLNDLININVKGKLTKEELDK